jgi:hypothetical protein
MQSQIELINDKVFGPEMGPIAAAPVKDSDRGEDLMDA